MLEFNFIFIIKKIINIHPATKPSEPSIKFVKFIAAVIKITRKNKIKKFNIGSKKKNKSIFPNLKIKWMSIIEKISIFGEL